MNILEAKEQIKNAMVAYFQKDSRGEYKIPQKRQRPVFLVGAPGIGKTAIMEQIAGELGVGLVSYSMIHHTRQSALGLPYIVKKQYGGEEVSVSEYTMSEIIASVYDMMEATGIREGILFLDEVNCVSETLAPAMLQFLQFKTFGRHALPSGWIVVTAGNPPEYNKSVRSFDVVTLDRLKLIEVAPDFNAWKEYAYEQKVHPGVMAYLGVKPEDFCRIETTAEGKAFVTPRGWDDLSEMIKEFEECGLAVNEALIGQYLRNPVIAKDFSAYYDLYQKYKSDYQIEAILAGEASAEIKDRAAHGGFDERLSLLEMALSLVNRQIAAVNQKELAVKRCFQLLKACKATADQGESLALALEREKTGLAKTLLSAAVASSLKKEEKNAAQSVLDWVGAFQHDEAFLTAENREGFALLKASFEREVAALGDQAEEVQLGLEHLFGFVEEVFGDGREMLLLVTEVTVNAGAVHFISRYGCEAYFAHNHELLFDHRQQEIDEALKMLEF